MASKKEHINNNTWLMDAEVRSEVKVVKGRWEVSLVFIDSKNPKRFLVQVIGDYHTEKLANIYAQNMKNTAAKDIRGTQKVKKNAYDFNNN